MIFIYLYLITLYIRPQDWIPEFYGWPVDYLILVPGLIVALIAQVMSKKKAVVIPQFFLLALFLLIVFISNLAHGHYAFGAEELIIFLKKVAIFLLCFFIIKSSGGLKKSLFFIALLSSIIAAQAIYQFSTGGMGLAQQDFYYSGTGVRTKWVGLWDGANILALLFNTSLPFALEFGFGPYAFLTRLSGIVFSILLTIGVYTTNSRGGFLTLISIFFIYPIFRFRKRSLAIIMGALLVLFVFYHLTPTRMSELSTSEESAHVRTRLWGDAIEMFKSSPILGIGKGQFIYNEENTRGLVAHSNFMQNLAEVGGLGIFIWIALTYFSFVGLWRIYRIKALPGTQEFRLASLSRALLISFLGFNICTLFITMEKDLFYLLLGLCAAAVNIAHREIKPISIKFSLKDVLAIFGIIVGLLGFYKIYVK